MGIGKSRLLSEISLCTEGVVKEHAVQYICLFLNCFIILSFLKYVKSLCTYLKSVLISPPRNYNKNTYLKQIYKIYIICSNKPCEKHAYRLLQYRVQRV